MTDIPIPEDRLRQMLRLARTLGAIAVTRADVAEHARMAGHGDFAAEVEASAITMGREALTAVVFLQAALDTTDGGA
ncbi:MAG: hypothetical protein VR70_12125 [Rhodospirillaceae bacterium BRH_c57]|nr:MAG: hypothetical protein VR70_12125 [Rhodospirillaceae bacterium BRH_c57]